MILGRQPLGELAVVDRLETAGQASEDAVDLNASFEVTGSATSARFAHRHDVQK
jgi:hypothetical protein